MREAPALKNRFESIASRIRRGRTAEAARDLEAIVTKTPLGRAERLSAASLSYRCGLPLVGLRLLSSVLRPRAPLHPPAQPDEIAVYSACLIPLGGAEEAMKLLSAVNPAVEPRAHYFRAAALMSRWRYQEAVPELHRFLESPAIDPYLRLVGEVNLLAGLLACDRLDESKALLNRVLVAVRTQEVFRLRMNAFELSAQYYIARREWEAAEESLAEANRCAVDEGTQDRLFVNKWRAVIEARRTGDTRALGVVRREAEAMSHWETMRECDRYRALIDEDEVLLMRVFFGTPHVAYRLALQNEFPRKVEFPSTFAWRWEKGGQELDLVAGRLSDNERRLPRTLHRLLLILSRDQYSPLRIVESFRQLFPDEHFNPRSSPNRVHQLVLRARKFFKEERLPLGVDQVGGSYRLVATGSVAIRVPKDAGEDASIAMRLRTAFGGHPFSAQEAASLLQRPLRTVVREVTDLVATNVLQRIGRSRTTKYKFCNDTI